jgi:hypothetical protein
MPEPIPTPLPESGIPKTNGPTPGPAGPEPPLTACSPVIKGYLADKLLDAERLLAHSAEAGIEVEDSIRKDVVKARFANDHGMTEETSANLLAALTKLAARLHPVTAESLKACAVAKPARSLTRFYILFALGLIGIIVPYSIATFVSSGISEQIRLDVNVANALAVNLSDELQPQDPSNINATNRGVTKPLPAGVTVKDIITDLQLFASTIRGIDARSRQLSRFLLSKEKDTLEAARKNPDTLKRTFELPPGLPDLPGAPIDRIEVYKNVRYFAQNTRGSISLTYGALANHLLPMLYALLGACAYLARLLEEQIKNQTFTAADRHAIHFLIAGIGGLVVGLFTNFNATQGAALSPLAFAFLVGYAVDVFFSFLEGFVQSFNKGRGISTGPGSGNITK